MKYFNSAQKIGEIVTLLPKASEIFKEYHIDFCCGGHRPLIEAIKEQNLEEAVILDRLEEAYEDRIKYSDEIDFRKLSSGELIDYIVNTHHSYVLRALPEISELAGKILKVHGVNHKELFKVHKLFHNLKTDLEQHLIKEEEILFPLIKEYELEPTEARLIQINDTLNETEEEHDAAGDILKELRKITNDYIVPDGGCNTYIKTFDQLKEFEADLFQHIHLENNILFKRLTIKDKLAV
jgi:regulator of cell morphogenesis and NO signaling